MFRLLLSLLLMVSLALPAQAINGDEGQFFFRYKEGIGAGAVIPVDDWASKTIHARFIGGVGILFSELLPLKPEWEDDNWQIDTGTLPAGISFNQATRTFEGRPESVQSGLNVILFGYDTTGNKVAKADVTFDIRELPANSVKVDLYAHTGKFFNNTIALPSGFTITRWEETELPPGGVDYNGRYVEGTPTSKGQWPILNLGYEYGNDTPIFAYYGTITVEDGPQFPMIADQLKNIGGQYSAALWDEWKVPVILRPIGDLSMVRYYVERSAGEKFPGSVRATGDDFKRTISGSVRNYYEQAKIRIKAIDSDGAEGYSNWFQIGSLGPQGICVPAEYPTIRLSGVVDKPFYSKGYTVKTANDASVKEFSVIAGSLPENVILNKDTGLISGTPVKEEKQLGVSIAIDFPNNPTGQRVICGPYDFTIAPSQISLDVTGVANDYRIGTSMSGQVTPTGGLLTPYAVVLDANSTLPETVTFDPSSGTLSGALPTAGTYTANFTLTNGNGVTTTASASFEVHDPLKIDPVPARSTIARLDSKSLFYFTYDTKAVIGSTIWDIIGGPLPEGIRLSSGTLEVVGGTVFPVGSYGPFKLKLTDGTGEFDTSDDFWIDVTPREPLIANTTVPPVFGVNTFGSPQPFSVTQAVLAQKLYKLEYSLSGPNNLPTTLSFDKTTGIISGTPIIKEVIEDFQVTVVEQSPEQLQAVSDTFSVTVNDPPPIGNIVSDYILRGNKDGVRIATRPLKTYLTSIEKKLVGGLATVKFVSVTPEIPGLIFNATDGVLEGVPAAEYNGSIVFHFEDGASREGSLTMPVKIFPYPTLTTQTSYELPRLASATSYNIKFEPNVGFYNSITWSLAPTSDQLPNGLKFSQGVITGATDAPVGTIRNIVVDATSTANGLKVTETLKIEVVARIPATLEFPDKKFLIQLNELTGAVVKRDVLVSSSYLKGSVVTPIVYELGPNTPSWLIINASTGAISGNPPVVRDWMVDVTAVDGEGARINGTVQIRATLEGIPAMVPGDQALTVREGETFKTDDQIVSNVVQPFKFVAGSYPLSFNLNHVTGSLIGNYAQAGVYSINMNVDDAHERKMTSPKYYRFKVIGPLALIGTPQSVQGRQYLASAPIEVRFNAPKNQISIVSYTITGDIPGTPYIKTVDPISGLAKYSRYDDQGRFVSVENQIAGEDVSATEFRLQPDHLVFDTETLILKGVPSRAGTFNMTLNAWDTHGSGYYLMADPTRTDNNSAEQNFSVSVLPAISLAVSNNANTENLSQYTSQPTIRSTVSNDAYGRGVTWQRVSGSLPDNVITSASDWSLSYRGYPENQGTFGNNIYRAIDVAGRAIDTEAVSFQVGPRHSFELQSSRQSPVQMVVFTEDAATKISAKNAAYGPNIGISKWVVTGQANLPPGVTVSVANDGVTFSGTSNVLGTYSGIQVRGTDPLGTTAAYNLTFNVVASSSPIVLNIFNVKTRVGYPIAMEPPFASNVLSTSNTYGKLRFYSNDIPSDIMLDTDTGLIAGVIDEAQKLSFDMYVTDETQRVTSEAVEIDVMPNLRVLVPTEIRVEPGQIMNQAIATDYVMGKVVYSKGVGNWPANFEVDPDDGRIYSTSSGGRITANMGTYTGLTIVATDTFVSPTFGTLIDSQISNTFSINVATAGSYLELLAAVMPDTEKRIKPYFFDFTQHLIRQNVDPSEIAWTTLAPSGMKVPPGLTLSSTGVLSGTPTSEGTFTFNVRAQKRTQTSITTTMTYTLEVKLPQISLVLNPHVFANMKRGDAFNFDLKTLLDVVNIEKKDVRFSRTVPTGSPQLTGITLNTTDGVLSGNWTNTGEYTFDIKARFANGTELEEKTTTYTIKVTGNSYEWTDLFTGGNSTCGINTDGETMCWGVSSSGKFGTGNTANNNLPMKIEALGTSMADMALGVNHSCVIMKSGQLRCAGNNSYGQLGTGDKDNSTTFRSVSLPAQVTKVAVGGYHTCAAVGGTDLYCWGYNSSFRLGDGTQTQQLSPKFIKSFPEGIKQISIKAPFCVVKNNGAVECWGLNGYGQVGTGATTAVTVPTPATVWGGDVVKLETNGSATTCALKTSGALQCIGNNSDYQFGTAKTPSRSATPVTVTGLETGVVDFALNTGGGCAVKSGGQVLCWGDGTYGVNGTGSQATLPTPFATTSQKNAVNIFSSENHRCALLDDGTAECWGYNTLGQIGDGTNSNRLDPTLVQ